ncbi:hypothetical protein CVU83_00455 [Candidatus Falkowbacteria bacterium HGW-Falkowbacteria-2]|uniref:HlyC/CorC family transporter n=1 Tax=Candidatus Falkowbacteria bacterium HGW-Falkowbacteria-2 TaxID=2013769 RepID=A0A2N2E387_9BACT|nr:MAG: hypothetical protein CVU83_00455 [Candidatus Falkowbacteria bacterium HGW-Falkowbacteria-2]
MVYLITGVLLTLSALFSGLNLGLMSLGVHELKRKAELGDKNAKKVYEVRKEGNLLLVTLLLGNVAVNAAIAICLNSITSGLIAGLVSTMLITLLGEIAPQALFSRFALSLGARVVWIVKVFLFILYPLAGPIAWVLDKIFGDELRTVYSKKELMQIISEHADDDSAEIRQDEERIALGAFTFGDKKIKEVMTPRSSVVTVGPNDKIDTAKINRLIKHGYSRYPVFDKDKDAVVGILYSHDIIGSKNINKRVSDISIKKINIIEEQESLDVCLRAFLKQKHKLFVVVNEFSEYTGVISIEDILEEIIGKEIVDEFDEYEDMRAVARQRVLLAKKAA